jgi:hypothetical protein
MTIKSKPKRSEFKTRKEYRFAVGKHRREIQKHPVVMMTAIVMGVVIVLTQNVEATIFAGVFIALIVNSSMKKDHE